MPEICGIAEAERESNILARHVGISEIFDCDMRP
jgi:hypothetical protein